MPKFRVNPWLQLKSIRILFNRKTLVVNKQFIRDGHL